MTSSRSLLESLPIPGQPREYSSLLTPHQLPSQCNQCRRLKQMSDINNVGSRFIVSLHPSLPYWTHINTTCLLTTNEHLMNLRSVEVLYYYRACYLLQGWPSVGHWRGEPYYTCGELGDYYGRLNCHNILRSELFIISRLEESSLTN